MSESTRVRSHSMISCEVLERRTLFAVTPNDPLSPQEWWMQGAKRGSGLIYEK